MHDDAGPPCQLIRWYGQAQAWKAGKQAGYGDPSFKYGQRGAKAVVDAMTEGKVRVRGTCRVELVSMIKAPRVVVGREQRQNHGFTGSDRDAGQLDLRCIAQWRCMHRWLEAQNLLDELSDTSGLCAEQRELMRVLQKRENTVADQVHRGFLAGDQQQVDH